MGEGEELVLHSSCYECHLCSGSQNEEREILDETISSFYKDLIDDLLLQVNSSFKKKGNTFISNR